LAYYRLGVALAHSSQPSAAADSFRAGIKVTPDLAAGYIGLASTLYDFETYRDANATAGVSSVARHHLMNTQRVSRPQPDAWQRVLRLLKNDERQRMKRLHIMVFAVRRQIQRPSKRSTMPTRHI